MIKGSLAPSSLFASSIECCKTSYDSGISFHDSGNLLEELLGKAISAHTPFASRRFHSSQDSFRSLWNNGQPISLNFT